MSSDYPYNSIALWLINEANGNASVEKKAEVIARYLRQLATSAMEHAYPIDSQAAMNGDIPLYSDVASSFEPPFPTK